LIPISTIKGIFNIVFSPSFDEERESSVECNILSRYGRAVRHCVGQVPRLEASGAPGGLWRERIWLFFDVGGYFFSLWKFS
jgi:hypothetical protein